MQIHLTKFVSLMLANMTFDVTKDTRPKQENGAQIRDSPVCYSCISFVKLHQSQSAPFDILGANHFDQHFLKLWSKKFRYFYSKTYQLTKHCRRLEFGSGAKVPALPCHQRCFSMQTEAVVLGQPYKMEIRGCTEDLLMPNFELLNYFVDPTTDISTKVCSTIRLLDLFMSSPTFDKRKKKNNYPIIRSKDRHSGDKVDEFFELINNHNFRMDNFEKIHPIDQIARFCVCRLSHCNNQSSSFKFPKLVCTCLVFYVLYFTF